MPQKESALALTAFQLPLDGFPDEIGPVFAFLKRGLDPGERPLREPRLHVFRPSFLPAHATGGSRIFALGQTISHMRY